MTITDILDSYEEVKEDLKFHCISGVRVKIMIILSEEPKKTEDLVELIKMPSHTILHSINELEKQNLVSNEGNNYYLSKSGEEIAAKLSDMIKTLIVLKNNRELWLYHEIDSIPQELLMEIGDLSNCELIKIENDDISKTHRTYTQIVLNSKEVKGVSPIFHPDYIEMYMSILNKGATVELVLTEDILKKNC